MKKHTFSEILSKEPTAAERATYEAVAMYDLLKDLDDACRYAGYKRGLEELKDAHELIEEFAEELDEFRRDTLSDKEEELDRRHSREEEIEERFCSMTQAFDTLVRSLYR